MKRLLIGAILAAVFAFGAHNGARAQTMNYGGWYWINYPCAYGVGCKIQVTNTPWTSTEVIVLGWEIGGGNSSEGQWVSYYAGTQSCQNYACFMLFQASGYPLVQWEGWYVFSTAQYGYPISTQFWGCSSSFYYASTASGSSPGLKSYNGPLPPGATKHGPPPPGKRPQGRQNAPVPSLP